MIRVHSFIIYFVGYVSLLLELPTNILFSDRQNQLVVGPIINLDYLFSLIKSSLILAS